MSRSKEFPVDILTQGFTDEQIELMDRFAEIVGKRTNDYIPHSVPRGSVSDLRIDKQRYKLGSSMRRTSEEQEEEALYFLRHSLIHRGQSLSVRRLADAMGYKSPRTAHVVLQRLIDKDSVKRKRNGDLQLASRLRKIENEVETVDVPLVSGDANSVPLLSKKNVEAIVSVSSRLAKPTGTYFLVRAKDDSMKLNGINPGDLLLVRQQSSAVDGDTVVTIIDGEAVPREYKRGKDAIVLKPRSMDRSHQVIVATEELKIQGKVTRVLSGLIEK